MQLQGRIHALVELAVPHIVRQDNLLDGECVSHIRKTADVILVEMGEDHQIQLFHLQLLQRIHDLVPVILLAYIDEHVHPVE